MVLDYRDLTNTETVSIAASIVRDPTLPNGHMVLYGLLLTYAPNFIVTEATLGQSLGIDRVTVCRWMRALIKRGLVSKERSCPTEHLKPSTSQDTCGRCGIRSPKLQNHRIKWGKDGGEYTSSNVVRLCLSCHRLVHSYRFIPTIRRDNA